MIMVVDLCSKCNGACCRVFSLPSSMEDLHKDLERGYSSWGDPKEEIRRMIDWLVPIDDTPIGRYVRKTAGEDHHVYTCKKLSSDGKCTAYDQRLSFCVKYDCHGQKQMAHTDVGGVPGIPYLNAYPKSEIVVEEKAVEA